MRTAIRKQRQENEKSTSEWSHLVKGHVALSALIRLSQYNNLLIMIILTSKKI